MILHPLRSKALEISKSYLRNETELISVLQQIQKEKLFLKWGHSSLFKYAVTELGLAENQAYTLISVSRKCSEVPELQAALETGKLNASRARRIVSVIEESNSSLWIEKAATLTQKQIEREVVSVRPETAVREKVKAISETRSMAVFGMTKELEAMLERVKELQAQSSSAPCNLEQAIQAMAEFFLKAKDPVQKAERAAARKKSKELPGSPKVSRTTRLEASSEAPLATEVEATATLLKASAPTKISRRLPIPAALKHEVFLRDQGQCQCKLPNGQRCNQKQWTEIHHLQPVAMGGGNVLSNLITLCHGHHRAIHERGSIGWPLGLGRREVNSIPSSPRDECCRR